MHFTQEDYRKIEAWLYQRTVKDTEFPSADPLDGTEMVPILQNNENKTIGLNNFVKQVADMKLPDFYNVTVNSKRPYLTLKEAVSLVPVKQRKLGLTITYHNEYGNWLIYQFKGDSLNQWDSLNYWNNIIQQAIEEFVLYPDEEDITGVRDGNRTFLKFKNREYNPEEFSGMGMIILRKNLVGTAACSIDDEDHLNNILTQDMINQENTVYIVQYDFDLDGKVISIPKGCTLWFQGGSINNGTMYLQETAILGAFEFADMGTAKLFGKFNTGQIMTFSNDSYKAKEGGYFVPSTKPSSATTQEDAKQDRETFYTENTAAYVTETRQELRWWNGEEWILILDITDYRELKSIISDLIDKHNAEMAACYKYFKARCYALELRVDDAERRLGEHDVILENHETRITKVEGDIVSINNEINSIHNDIDNIEGDINSIEQNITNVTNDISNITNNIADIQNIVENLDQTIENHIQQFIENNVVGVASVTVNGQKYVPDSNGNISLPDYPEAGGGTADKVAGKLKFTGASTAEYDGSSDVTVNIPEGGSGGGVADSVKGTLTIKSSGGTTLGTYNGSADKTITLPPSGGGEGDTIITAKETLTIKQGNNTLGTYDGTEPKTITIPAPVTLADPDTKTLTLQDQKGNVKHTYNAKEDKTVKVGSVLFRQNSGDTLHDALDSTQTILDLRPYMNGGYGHPTILYSAEIVRNKNTTAWRESYSQKHEGVGSVSFSTDNSLLKITLSSKSGWDIAVASACANSRDMDGLGYRNPGGNRLRSNGGWIQCATDTASIVYLHAWRTGDKNNDTVHADCLHKDGKCLGLSIIVIGYTTKVN